MILIKESWLEVGLLSHCQKILDTWANLGHSMYIKSKGGSLAAYLVWSNLEHLISNG